MHTIALATFFQAARPGGGIISLTKAALWNIIFSCMGDGAKRIGVLLNDVNSDYVKEIVDGVFSVCQKNGSPLFDFCVGELDYSYRPFDYHQKVLARLCNKANIDGLVVCSSVLGNHIPKERLEEYVKSFSSLPIVSIGTKIPGVPSVVCSARAGIESVLDDLVVHHGCKKICLLGVIPGSAEAAERSMIVSDYMAKQGLLFDERCVIGGNFTYEGAMKCLEDYWEEKGSFDFDAVFALNDDMAFAAIDFLARRKIAVPGKVRVAGFDDVPRAALCEPSLTTVNQQLFEQGAAAAEALFSLLQKKRVPNVIEVSSAPRFRKSCGCEERALPAEKGADGKDKKSLSSNAAATEWLEKKTQFHMLNSFLASGQRRLNLAKFRKAFRDLALRFDISAAAVCVYNEPVVVPENSPKMELPEEACVFSAYDNKRDFVQNINGEPPFFNPRETILPDGFIDFSSGQYMAFILSNCENQYGYILFRKGYCENLVYSMMCVEFSRLFSGAWESSKSEKAARIQQERTARLNLISKTDELTGLLNRRGFMELGQQTIDIAVVLNQGGVVIFGDMDGLKSINDTFGHDAGDRAIKAEAEILRKNFRASDIVGRLGGDEFVIIAAGLGEPRLAEIRENIDAACKAWNIVHNEGFELSISLGCKPFTKDMNSLDEILKEADELLYEEKRGKKNARR